jgi:hypothetical protein
MPIAGGNVMVFYLRIENNRLINIGMHRYPAHGAIGDVAEAVRRLTTSSDTVFLQALGANLVNVKAALRERGVEVKG